MASGNNVIVHSVHRHDPNPVIEYLLPCAEMPADVQRSLTPWLQQMVGKSSEDVAQILRERWSDVEAEPLRKLRDYILEYRPVSITVYRSQAHVGLARADWGGRLFVPPPLDTERVEQLVAEYEADQPVFREFLQLFAGLREEPPKWSGYFEFNQVTRFEELAYDVADRFQEWQSAKVLYRAISGDSVLMDSSGTIAWYVLPENKIKPLADDFEGFIRHYVETKNQSNHGQGF